MALEPCNVCGTLNSSEAEICLSCGYPTNGRRRSPLFQWVAIALVLMLVGAVGLGLVNALTPRPSVPPPPVVPNPPSA